MNIGNIEDIKTIFEILVAVIAVIGGVAAVIKKAIIIFKITDIDLVFQNDATKICKKIFDGIGLAFVTGFLIAYSSWIIKDWITEKVLVVAIVGASFVFSVIYAYIIVSVAIFSHSKWKKRIGCEKNIKSRILYLVYFCSMVTIFVAAATITLKQNKEINCINIIIMCSAFGIVGAMIMGFYIDVYRMYTKKVFQLILKETGEEYYIYHMDSEGYLQCGKCMKIEEATCFEFFDAKDKSRYSIKKIESSDS